MGYGFEIPGSSPKDAANSMNPNAAAEETFGDVMASAPTAPQVSSPSMGMGEAFADSAPITSVLPSLGMPPQQMATAPTPGRPYANKQVEAIRDERDEKNKEALLAEQDARLSPTEKGAKERVVSQQEIDQEFANVAKIFGENPPARSEFSDTPEGIAEAGQRFRQDPIKFFKDSWDMKVARMRAGLGETDSQKFSGYQKVWQDDKTGRAVAVKDGKMYIKYSKNTKSYQRVGDSTLDTLSNMITDHLGSVINLGTSIPTQIMGDAMAIGAGGAVGAATKSPAAAAATTFAGHRMASAAAGAIGPLAVRGAQKTMDLMYGNEQLTPEESDQLSGDMMWSAGINVAADGLMFGLGRAGSKLAEKWKEGGQLERIFRLDAVKQRVQADLSRMTSYAGETTIGKGLTAAANAVNGVIDTATNKFIGDISNLESKALQLAGKERKFSSKNTIAQIRRFLEDHHATFDDKTGKVTLPDVKAKADLGEWQAIAASVEPTDLAGQKELAEVLPEKVSAVGAANTQTKNAFGTPQGRKYLSDLADHYENMVKAEAFGGSDLKTTLNILDSFRTGAKQASADKAPTELIKMFQDIQNAGVTDRMSAFESLFTGTGLPEEKLYKSVYDNYHKNIEDHLRVRKIFANQEAIENAVMQVGRSADSLDFVKNKLLGPASKEWQQFRGEYINDMIQKSIDPGTGIFSGGAMMKKLQGISQDAQKHLFGPGEFKQLMDISRVADTIPYTDLITEAQGNALTALAGFMPGASKVTQLRALFAIGGKNLKAMDYLANDSLHKKSLEAITQTERNQYQAAQSYLTEMMSRMEVISVKRKGKMIEMLVPKASGAVKNTLRDGLMRMKAGGGNAMETGVFMHPPSEESPEPQI